ncbi:MAG: recombination protein O N-terminal domain-containing protein [Candidatus Gracilibacteria bacterium]
MSIFKTKGIILKIQKIKSGEFLYTIFTRDYGKILCNKKFSKTEKTLDLGYLINFEITTKENVSIHKIRNIKIISELNRDNKTFDELNSYLIILSLVHNKIPTGSPIYELFNLLELINSYPNLDKTKLILTRLKIISILGELNETHNNETISKILKFINSNKIDRILKLTGITEELKKELEII